LQQATTGLLVDWNRTAAFRATTAVKDLKSSRQLMKPEIFRDFGLMIRVQHLYINN